MTQTLKVTNLVHLPLTAQPIRHGLPWPGGSVDANTAIVVSDESGARLPAAVTTLNTWPDGSVQWSLLDLALDLPPSGERLLTIAAVNGDDAPVLPARPVIVTERDDGVTLDNGLTALACSAAPAASLVQGWEGGALDAVITDSAGTVFSAARCAAKRLTVEAANPLRAVLRLDGKHCAADGRTLLDFWIRLTVTAGRRDVRITYHYHNLEAAEPGVDLQSMALRLTTGLPPSAKRVIVQVNRGRNFRTEPVRLDDDLTLCASNTMDLASYPETHVGITGGGYGRVFISEPALLRDDPLQKPWFLRQVVDFKFQSGDAPEAYTWSCLGLVGEAQSLVVAGGNMVGLHPKSLSVRGNLVSYDIWPTWAGTMDVTQGEGRTLDFFVGPLPGGVSDAQVMQQYLSWELGGLYPHWPAQAPITVSMDRDHVRECAVFQVDRLPRYAPDTNFAFERKVETQWAPDEAAPATGHWHYGDVFSRWDIGANNEEMVGHVWFQEYLRTGRPNCLARGLAQAQHIADVDICAYSADPYQNGGMCAHGPRHNHSAAYPSHMWFTELLFAYALTGDCEFRKAAARVCDNLTFWINDDVGFANVCADGRESGQPLINLAWTYQFVPEPRYLAAMWKIVRKSFMARVAQHGSLVYMKPREDLPLIRFASYGEWAAWEGLFCVWHLTGDESLREFILSQLDWRLQESRMRTSGSFRDTDFNVAAYAYYLSGEAEWLARVARPFKVVFRSVAWPMGYIKTMYFIALAFEHGLVSDGDVLIS